ncbi:hypothetical protein ACJRO7_033508 [Eucalyptus globulus]|uniref:Uncharacterized protein n=1 Tax=Eucalyptus globulus TaxID=34317 RepID=A0ABD3JMT2_EUCGL
MKGGTVQINWHETKPVLTLDFHPLSGLLATGGADFDIEVCSSFLPLFIVSSILLIAILWLKVSKFWSAGFFRFPSRRVSVALRLIYEAFCLSWLYRVCAFRNVASVIAVYVLAFVSHRSERK